MTKKTKNIIELEIKKEKKLKKDMAPVVLAICLSILSQFYDLHVNDEQWEEVYKVKK